MELSEFENKKLKIYECYNKQNEKIANDIIDKFKLYLKKKEKRDYIHRELENILKDCEKIIINYNFYKDKEEDDYKNYIRYGFISSYIIRMKNETS